MIGYIKGMVDEVGLDYVIVENNGIGYKLLVSGYTTERLEKGADVKIYTQMIVREDDLKLCGFYTKLELDMFNLLTSVSKIGPKVALSMLSFADPYTLQIYILNSDIGKLSKAPGVGKKTAERIVLELRDKVSKMAVSMENFVEVEDKSSETLSVKSEQEDAIEALLALGYSQAEASDAVRFVSNPAMETEEIIKLALEFLMK